MTLTPDASVPHTLDDVRALYPGVETRPDSDAAADRVLGGVDHLTEVASADDIALMRESLSLWFARSFDPGGEPLGGGQDEGHHA